MVPIFFKCSYSVSWDSTYPCKGVLTLYLPCDQNGFLLESLQGPDFVLRDKLVPDWGEISPDRGKNFRQRSYPIYGKDWNQIEAEIQLLVKETEETLKKIKRRNESIPLPPPQDWEQILVL